MIREVQCASTVVEDNHSFKEDQSDQTATNILIKLLHPKLKLQRMIQAKILKNTETRNDQLDPARNVKLFTSSCSQSFLTLSVVSMVVTVWLFL